MSSKEGRQLPKGWATTTLAEIVEPRSGKADPQASPEAKFIGMEQVEAHTMRLLGTVPASSMKSSANAFQPNDVLYGRLRAYLNKVYQPEFAGLCSGEFIVLPETSAVHGRFLKYRLNSGDFVRFASQINTGDRPRVDWDQIKNFGIAFPPKPEQERIADTLDELLSDIEAGVASLERARANLQRYRAAVLKAAVEGALTREWRRLHPVTESASALLTRIRDERRSRWEEALLQKFLDAGKSPPKDWRAKYVEPAAPDTANLPRLPDGWCWTTLDTLFVAGPQNGAYFPSERYGSGIPILRIDDYQNGWTRDVAELRRVSTSQQDAELYALREGDLVINRVNSMTHLGKSLVVSKTLAGSLFESNMMRSSLASLLVPDYIETYLHSGSGRQRLIKGAKWAVNQASINQEDVKRTAISLPPLAEQAAIVEAVEDQLSVIEHVESDIEAKLKSAQGLRQSILRHAFNGQLVSQDPNDEPASELLKRIAAERGERNRVAQAAKQVKHKSRTLRTRVARS